MNHDLLQLTEKYDAPLYVYDADIIKRKYQAFIKAFDVPKLDVHFACKSLNNIHILKYIHSLGCKLDCVSIQEVMLGLYVGYNPSDVLFTPNGISEQEYDDVVGKGVAINVDNIQMLEYLATNYPEVPICIRINPHLRGGGNSKISVGTIDSKFGISIHQAPHIYRIIKQFGLNVEGIHLHTGSDILDGDIFIRAAELLFNIVKEIDTVKYIDFGSGFKVSYKPDDFATNIPRFGKTFSDKFNAFCKEMGRDYTLKFEPGKYLVSESGTFLVKVNVIKQTTACTFVHVDSGLNHFIRPMFYNAYHHIDNLSNPDGAKKLYNVVGYICETDTFAYDRIIPEVRKEDVLAIRNAGAYCFTMASNYNSRYRPAEVMIKDGKDQLIRRRETFEDLLNNQIDLA